MRAPEGVARGPPAEGPAPCTFPVHPAAKRVTSCKLLARARPVRLLAFGSLRNWLESALSTPPARHSTGQALVPAVPHTTLPCPSLPPAGWCCFSGLTPAGRGGRTGPRVRRPDQDGFCRCVTADGPRTSLNLRVLICRRGVLTPPLA